MEKRSVTIELDSLLLTKLTEIAAQMGISVAEWCAFAVTQQLTMQESMKDLLLQAESFGLNIETLDFDTITQQLFSSPAIDLDGIVEESGIILPDNLKRKDITGE
ncbi:hypothetical protein [Ammoniphilus sp. YIM 78166]|uniref:hypothetical protein n=1 Tax=Ammoniphilus sp. YIM 78166 TaxID=1644106 RepID=UPI00106FE3E9|nr:hypothetical protein [Ammoniphilus sp. YIM 78166]